MSEVDSNKILSDITVFNKYAKFIKAKGRRETWDELVTRNMEMHIRKHPFHAEEIISAYQFVYEKKVLPSMRSLQFGGRPIELANNRVYNCAYMPMDDVDAFSELMFLLLGGTGGGYSVQSHHVSKLPLVVGTSSETRRFLVGDSIEGWADAVKVVMEAYFLGKNKPMLDFSDIREKGAELITTGGKAPGPEPLKACIKELARRMDRAVGRQLTPLEVHDISCIIADAVLAGGIRRAALICLFDRNDYEMLNAKGNYKVQGFEVVGPASWDEDWTVVNLTNVVQVGHADAYGPWTGQAFLNKDDMAMLKVEQQVPWYTVQPQRGRANNSAVLPRTEVTRGEFMGLMKVVEASKAGEPGVYWTSDIDWGTNPCCEIALRPFQFCNLCTINVSNIISQEDLNARAKAAAFIGTLQATYTDFHYLRPIWKQTTEMEALIGVSMTGIGSDAIGHLDTVESADVVNRENERAAFMFGINVAARKTTVKPEGTASLVVGSSSGVHAWHNDYYLRRQRMGKDEALYKYLVKKVPALIEDDVTNANQAIASFPQKAPEGSILRTESSSDLLSRVRDFNLNWVRTGHDSGANTHNVSCTISVKDDEWDEVATWMWNNRHDYNGIAVLPYDGGTYVQAPFEDITEEKYLEMIGHLTEIDLTEVREGEDNTDLSGELACSGGTCDVSF